MPGAVRPTTIPGEVDLRETTMQIRGFQPSSLTTPAPTPAPTGPSRAPLPPAGADDTAPRARPASRGQTGRDRRLGGGDAELGSVSRPRPPQAWVPWRSAATSASPAGRPPGADDTSPAPHGAPGPSAGEATEGRRGLGRPADDLGSVFRPRPPQAWVPWRSAATSAAAGPGPVGGGEGEEARPEAPRIEHRTTDLLTALRSAITRYTSFRLSSFDETGSRVDLSS